MNESKKWNSLLCNFTLFQNPGSNPSEVPDEKALIGFAQLSITAD